MNEEILTYNTPNSEEILSKIQKYEFKRVWKNNLKKSYKNLFWGISFLLLCAVMLFYKEHFGYFFLGVGLMYFFIFFNYLLLYTKAKKKFNDLLNREIKALNQNSKDVIWEFTPKYFSFKNYKSEYKFTWETITYCIIDNQYLYIKVEPYINIILDKANIGEHNLNLTLQYLQAKACFKELN